MDLRWQPVSTDSLREVAVHLYGTGVSPAQVAAGAAQLSDLSPYITRCTQTESELQISCAFYTELYCAGQPKPGQTLAAKLGGQILWQGIIESVSDYRERSGERSISFTARSRDATPAWREVPRITREYPQGTRLDLIARDVARDLDLQEEEILVSTVGVSTPQSSTQLADIPAWAMLEALLVPAGLAPYIDGLARLRTYSKDITRTPDVVLTDERVIAISGSRTRPSLSSLVLAWRDPKLTLVRQQDRSLANATITAGFFQLEQNVDVFFSEDRTQRAFDTRLVVQQSANSGLLPICDESYTPNRDPGSDEITGGRIKLETFAYVPALLASFVAIKAAGAFPDIAPSGGGPTTPIGKIAHAALELVALITLASIGTGVYEIHGKPFDYVNARNRTRAYNINADPWSEKNEEIESDFISNEAHAQAVATREFLYRALQSGSYSVQIVDDPRIEVGDILQLPDRSKVYCTGYSRDLSFGAPAVLNVSGFAV